MRHRPPAVAATCIISITLLTACATGTGTEPTEEPVASLVQTIRTPAGATIELPSEPRAALGFYTTDIDILLTLDYPLASSQPVRDDFTNFPDFFPLAELEGLSTFTNYPEFNFEGVAAAEPDFVLNGLGYDTELDPKLQEIAPTYTYNAFDGGDWREPVAQTASDLGREEQWQAWNSSYEQRVASIRTRLDDAGIDPVVAALDPVDEDGSGVAAWNGVPWLVFDDLGLRTAEVAGPRTG
ncbi:ABC transporter substrate-binding protein [Naumannella halotolerans]|uniref:ABC transporter substrate-binding protein n=1 Tax=Naumannella halotolerans TaxID=993414 RepID=UPI00106120C5|nr:ABC transporter substrate-binding protein [Naumannella halotolerans]